VTDWVTGGGHNQLRPRPRPGFPPTPPSSPVSIAAPYCHPCLPAELATRMTRCRRNMLGALSPLLAPLVACFVRVNSTSFGAVGLERFARDVAARSLE